ncbi:phage tail tape measure protein [Pseudomonas mediterranea]|uniref:Phage tail tape measure protein, TP901 family, core region n=1 Tax=Pseudomonas mediterranea TaxID=183795 RepID=A0AAX2DIR7_9PSED|nr:phage tail tape measure protein [Pseudomonas mediterranea]KGU84755.1 phage tail length tape measure protein [Pseudomonas mediterranea CFBP 5447]MDU9027269.1 phage tail tape measure protein [Pseudomonas mediterranea]QHA81235.1 phage tail tape measure protein [Pseudomonas mediterranea]SDU74258.1 phage tail tape measure protein, TP901 family, core region [Pseudomonas mediterranea]
MAESKYSLSGAASIELPSLGSVSETSGLNLALSTASLDIRLLVSEQVKLRETLASLNVALSVQQSLLKAGASVPAPNSEPKSKLKADVDQQAPPGLLKSAMATELAMVELNQVLKLDRAALQQLSQANLKMAADKQVAPSGATAVQLVQVELAAAKAGVGEGSDPVKRQDELLSFTRDSAVMASSLNLDVKTASEMLLGWRNSMNLDRGQRQTLADATNHLGNSGLNVKAADIGAVVQRSGEAGLAAGMTPEQVAALAAAFLNSGVSKAEAGDAAKGFTAALAQGNAATPEQRKAWAELNPKFDPAVIANGLRNDAPGTINQVLEALKQKPAQEKQALTKALFGDNAAILELLKKPEGVQKAFTLVSERTSDGTLPKFNGSLAATAEALGNTSQGRFNALDASKNRVLAEGGNALAPLTDGVMVSLGALADGLSEVAQAQPKATAGLLVLAGALALARGAEIKVAMVSAVTAAATKLLALAGARQISEAQDLTVDAPEQRRKGKKTTRRARQGNAAKSASIPVPSMTSESRLLGAARMGSAVTRRAAPLMLLSAGYDVAKGLQEGDDKAVGRALGSAGGGLAGTYAGAAAGAMIGSVVPILGTAVGGVIGGLLGSMAGSWGGEWLGEKLATPADKLDAPEQVSKDLTSSQTSTQQNTMTANIYINGQDQASASQLANLVVQQITGQFGLTTMPNSLAMRSDAALTDGGT